MSIPQILYGGPDGTVMTVDTGVRSEIRRHKKGETMKPRKVIITIEAKSDIPLKTIKGFIEDDWCDYWCDFVDADKFMDIHQVHVQNIIDGYKEPTWKVGEPVHTHK